MKRRHFAELGTFGAALFALPMRSHAQQSPKLPRIGWLWQGRSAGNPQEMTGFRQGLKDFGYVEGQNVTVFYRFAEGHNDAIPGLLGELMQLRPDVLVAVGAPVSRLMINAVKNATDIPIVSLSSDPVAAGLVASLARPGGRVTGVSMMQGPDGLTGKRIDLLKDALPTATRVGMMFNPEYTLGEIAQAQKVASRRGITLLPSPVRRVDEIEDAITMLARERVDAVDVEPSSPFISYQPEIATLLLQHKIPAVSELRALIEAGGLISYGPSIFDAAKRLAYFVDRILKGAKPADLPVEQATRFEMVVNMKTARLLNIELSPILLARADELIE